MKTFCNDDRCGRVLRRCPSCSGRWLAARPGLNAGRCDHAVLVSAYDVPLLLGLLDAVTEERDEAQAAIRASWRTAGEDRA